MEFVCRRCLMRSCKSLKGRFAICPPGVIRQLLNRQPRTILPQRKRGTPFTLARCPAFFQAKAAVGEIGASPAVGW
jgi:hypothetical protein